MQYLTPQQVLFIHARLITLTGGTHGIRDVGLLASAVARPQATFDGEELYEDVFARAAALMESLIRNHPFVDGNKRVGHAAMETFLILNGYEIFARVDEQESVMLSLAAGKMSRINFLEWLNKHISHITNG